MTGCPGCGWPVCYCVGLDDPGYAPPQAGINRAVCNALDRYANGAPGLSVRGEDVSEHGKAVVYGHITKWGNVHITLETWAPRGVL